MDASGSSNPTRQLIQVSADDQLFLVNFIIGTYLGPDVITETPRRSAAQRVAENLPPYSKSDLGSSFVGLPQVESLYYYVLRNAFPNAAMKLRPLQMYLKGTLPLLSFGVLSDARQFINIFPLNLHEQTRYRGAFKIFKGVVIIEDPDISYIKPEDLERFMLLSGQGEVKINKDEALAYRHGNRAIAKGNVGSGTADSASARQENKRKRTAMKNIASGSASASAGQEKKRKRVRFVQPLNVRIPHPIDGPSDAFDHHQIEESYPRRGPSIVIEKSALTAEQTLDPSQDITGATREGRAGPPVGLVEMGVSDKAYLFRVCLPGIKRERRDRLKCYVEKDGKVTLQGEAKNSTGVIGSIRSDEFKMITDRLCAPGPFEVKFNLPGPVDPRLVIMDFRDDGIFEAAVFKDMRPMPSPSVNCSS